jgi:hypothetical protein
VKTGDSSLTFIAVLESTGRNVTAGNFSGLLRLKMEYSMATMVIGRKSCVTLLLCGGLLSLMRQRGD